MRKKKPMERQPIQVIKVSETLYVASMGGDNVVHAEMKGTTSLSGELLEAYTVSSTNGKIRGYFEQKPGNSPVELIQTLVSVYAEQQEVKDSLRTTDE